MQEAIARLKATLGPDAVIVSTRRGSDHRGMYVEITATGSEQLTEPEAPPALGGARGASAAYARAAAPAPAPERAPASQRPFAERAAWLARQMAARREEPEAPAAPSPAPLPRAAAPAVEVADLQRELAALREAVSALSRPVTVSPDPTAPAAEAPVIEAMLRTALAEVRARLEEIRALVDRVPVEPAAEPATLRALRAQLVAVGVAESHADELARAACAAVPDATPDDGTLLAHLGHGLARGLVCAADPLLPQGRERRVLAFVGPTGVGKTTTIAKVAAHARLMAGIPTALVTVDTFRMAAVEQLARYADILECPLRVVKQPDELQRVLDELSAKARLILVDTTGRNPRAEDQVSALARFFPEGWGGRAVVGQTVLTVAASTRERDLFTTVDAFARLKYDLLCVTKTDETDALGMVYTLARRAARPLAWTTHGQRVPEDIERADAAAVAARVVAAAAQRGRVALAG